MRRSGQVRRAIGAILLSATLVLGAGCSLEDGGQSTQTAETAQTEVEEVSPDQTSAEASMAEEGSTAKLHGRPWLNSNDAGNYADTQPASTDDLYAHYNYDFLVANTDTESYASVLLSSRDDMAHGVVSVINDTAKRGHDLDQLRILFGQAHDADALAEIGYSEVMPYVEAVDACETIDELNDLLCSRDFPVEPFVDFHLSFSDKRGTTEVSLDPGFIFVDPFLEGAIYYQDTDDEIQIQTNAAALLESLTSTEISLGLMGLSDEEAEEVANAVLDFEKEYGKFADYGGKYLDEEYGAYTAALSVYTLDELEARLENIPVRRLLERLGLEKSEHITVSCEEWLVRLDELWQESSLETMKWSVKAKIAAVLRPYVDPALYADVVGFYGTTTATDADTFAFEACAATDALNLLVGRAYVDEVLGEGCRERLLAMAEGLTDTYAEIFGTTAWLSDESHDSLVEKLENMTFNVLEPDGATIDYAALDLTPTDEGGTLVSNFLATKRYNDLWRASMVGRPAWGGVVFDLISTSTFNCFYEATTNSINIMPGMVGGALYREGMTDEELLGTFGFMVAHEISHGFDYMGSQFSAYGTPEPVISEGDVQEFVARRQRLVDYYDGIEYNDGLHVNGTNVSAEAAADLTGMQVVLRYLDTLPGASASAFFESMAHLWASVYRVGLTEMLATDTHPLDYLRINVNAQMFEDFYETYGCKEGDAMYLAPDLRISIWGADASKV